ncbi:ATP-binding cassette domain-containing protein [Tsukamurella sp. 8F]|uniref:ABC transporter ATP-binding protein n=1 Tax=unclassified Tsukamurella TaxID=2633480 RepID=UPI0023B97445|nr:MULTISPECIES: ATP-binding cassette domain-containing protein [unclassified Tsukamurella]MDF0529798.1 ATP-binding cassette domain-containing protein [Tsukamurella sp. 8J]MDF0586990.1 ATP-binding cassette domain-containing protein [Tsukamurella sp. 8F]
MSLEIDHLSKQYGSVRALDGVTFTVRPGEVYGFVGSNGAGKSTTMRIAVGVLAADSGTVRIAGHPVDAETRRRIGYMPEERGLYPKMKVGEQLRYLARLHGFSAASAARAAETWTDRLGVGSRREDTVDALSLGNQQRVQLAAALVHSPDVLILDEPFSGLDPVAVDVMSDVLREKAREGVPVLFSSHQLDLVQRLCDRVGIITHGALRAEGTVADLRATGAAHLTVATDAPSGWADRVPGVVHADYRPGRTVLTLADGTDTQPILHAALAYGPVREFASARPDLTELFREVVSA